VHSPKFVFTINAKKAAAGALSAGNAGTAEEAARRGGMEGHAREGDGTARSAGGGRQWRLVAGRGRSPLEIFYFSLPRRMCVRVYECFSVSGVGVFVFIFVCLCVCECVCM